MLGELWKEYKGRWWVWVGLFFLLSITAFLSIQKGNLVYTHYTDFSGFYTAAWHFEKGMPLYGDFYPHISPYMYPPFTAMLFQFLLLFTPELAFGIFNFINIILFLLTLAIILKLLDIHNFPKKIIYQVLIATIIFSARFQWTNFDLGQVNLLMLLGVLLGFYSYLKEKYIIAAFLFTFCASFKVIPAVFLLWLILSKFRKDVILTTLTSFLVFFILPIFFRGIELSMTDLQSFYKTVFAPYFFDSGINLNHSNQSFSAFLGRLLMHSDATLPFHFNLADWSAKVLSKIAFICKILFAIPFFIMIYQQVKQKGKPSILVFSFIFIFVHLVSGLTWKNHQVDLIFALIPIFLLDFRKLSTLWKLSYTLIIGLLFVMMFNVLAFTGEHIKIIINGLGLNTILLLVLYMVYAAMYFVPKKFPLRYNPIK